MDTKRKRVNKKLELCQGDVILAYYDRINAGKRNGVIRPSVVVSNNTSLQKEIMINVIPLYRTPSKAFQAEDILIRPFDCRGLRYEEYAQPRQMQALHRSKVIKRIGRIRNDSVLYQIVDAVWNSIGVEL